MNRKLLWTLTGITVLSVGNIYYSQPLLGEIAKSFQRSEVEVGIAPTLTQMGYVAGLFFVVPLGDVLERRRLLTVLLLLAGFALLGCAIAPNLEFFLGLAIAVGITAALVQIIIPFVASLSQPAMRSRNLGVLLSGALIGVLISRTVSGLLGGQFGWRAVYYSGSFLMFASALSLRILLPRQEPQMKIHYARLLGSLWKLFRDLPQLRAIAVSGALVYAALSAFWASLAFYLHSDVYDLGPRVAGAFGLVGALGAVAASLVGRTADRIGPRKIVRRSVWVMLLSFLTMALFGSNIYGLVIGVILLDLGAQAVTVSNQTQLYGLHGEAQTRLNTIYKMMYFAGGAVGSAFSAISYQAWGWSGVCAAGSSCLIAALVWERKSLSA